ncbi:YfgM family protein [Neisseria sp. Ec49-e6-T10]|uniref:YfgM family protein n=1 Tax=Neisseria sp. Ec49-e6-T10 TaxID=3140744 RepID=UPI003EB7E6BC
MAYTLQEQEEIDGFKHFWKSGGAILCALIVIAAIGYFGWTIYQSHQKNEQAKAGNIFNEFVTQIQGNNIEAADKQFNILLTEHQGSPSTAGASLIKAGYLFNEKKYEDARKNLEWVLTNNKEPLFQALATQRLALVYLQEQKYNEALETINKPVDPNFDSVMLDIKGDIYAAQGKSKEAKEAYNMALAKMTDDVPGKELIELKRDQQGQ